ncbi:MAG: iron-containing redox enzyme family protein [Solirubrobacterales bacterium]|nr:iron-containing redox enzyme family protein [Solirubrobacterales bacterium]
MSTNMWDRIEEARAASNVLEHPFYQRWSAGELTRDELAEYAGQYRYATEAIAKLSADVAAAAPEAERTGLEAHAAEEHDHVAMWDGFVNAVGGTVGAEPNPETVECAEAWTRADGFGRQLARLFAIESGQPAISKTKTEGLGVHYGISGGPGNLYFTVHEEMDVQHAAEGRKLIERYMNEFSEDEIVSAAAEAFKANWLLLDGVEKARA